MRSDTLSLTSSVYRFSKEADLITAPDYVVIKAADEFTDKTTAINEMWQTDFTYCMIIGWGWYYLAQSWTITAATSFPLPGRVLRSNAERGGNDAPTCGLVMTDAIELALTASGFNQAVVRHKPRLLSDNGSCYISGDLAEWLERQSMTHIRGAPFHLQAQGKIPLIAASSDCRAMERWHQTMKNRVLLENYYLPGDLERQIGSFVEYYNNQRYHESLNNVTPADVYFGHDKAILREREKIKEQTIRQHQKQAA
jgi:transposase InsO family protein